MLATHARRGRDDDAVTVRPRPGARCLLPAVVTLAHGGRGGRSQEIGKTQTRRFEPSGLTSYERSCAFSRPLREANTMQGLQGELPIVVIIAVAAFLAGLCVKRLRAELARQAWQKRRWRRGEEGVRFFARSLVLSLKNAAERAINTADFQWRVMAQVSLGEVLSSPNARGYSAINSKRVDLLIVSRSGDPIAAIEYQGHGHYQGTAAARDAVKKEAPRKAGVRYIEVTPESGTDDMAREISRIAQVFNTYLSVGDGETPSKERGALRA